MLSLQTTAGSIPHSIVVTVPAESFALKIACHGDTTAESQLPPLELNTWTRISIAVLSAVLSVDYNGHRVLSSEEVIPGWSFEGSRPFTIAPPSMSENCKGMIKNIKVRNLGQDGKAPALPILCNPVPANTSGIAVYDGLDILGDRFNEDDDDGSDDDNIDNNDDDASVDGFDPFVGGGGVGGY